MRRTRLIFVTGKGGTGKSAVAAATAIDFARRGHRVLAIDMLGHSGLAAHLSAPDLRYDPTEVRAGLFALAMNRSDALDEYLKTQLHLPHSAPTRHISAALAALAETAPGVREILSIGKPIAETATGAWDVVIVDAPPLGQFQSYLRAPKTITELVQTGNVHRLARGLAARLRSERVTAIHIVTTPSELPILETKEAITTIRDGALGPTPIIILNRVLASSGLTASDLESLKNSSLQEAAVLQLRLEAERDKWIDEIPHSLVLPYLLGVFTPGEVTEQLSDKIAVPL